MATRKKYVQVGTGGRARFFYEAIAGRFSETSELLAFCDMNQTRMDYANNVLSSQYGLAPIPTYTPDRFDEMVLSHRPDAVIVTSIDRTHHRYIIRAMELGCDVISEKPMTIDENKAQAILDAIRRTGRKLRVTFNYRYAPHNTKVRELIMDDTIGDIFSVHFEWLLNTQHGADYFRRWHRDKRNSGGLLVHKATHHFDLVNFWLGSRPKTVFAMGDLNFYGRENAEKRGVTRFYTRAHGSGMVGVDPFALDMENNPQLKGLYLDAEKDDGYIRDQSVFGDGINIEDTMGVMVRYRNNAILTYSLNAYLPWEGYRVAFNGSKGRIQVAIVEQTYECGRESGTGGRFAEKEHHGVPDVRRTLRSRHRRRRGRTRGRGSGALERHFRGAGARPVQPRGFHVDGAMSILTGIAANKSIATGMPVQIDQLVQF